MAEPCGTKLLQAGRHYINTPIRTPASLFNAHVRPTFLSRTAPIKGSRPCTQPVGLGRKDNMPNRSLPVYCFVGPKRVNEWNSRREKYERRNLPSCPGLRFVPSVCALLAGNLLSPLPTLDLFSVWSRSGVRHLGRFKVFPAFRPGLASRFASSGFGQTACLKLGDPDRVSASANFWPATNQVVFACPQLDRPIWGSGFCQIEEYGTSGLTSG